MALTGSRRTGDGDEMARAINITQLRRCNKLVAHGNFLPLGSSKAVIALLPKNVALHDSLQFRMRKLLAQKVGTCFCPYPTSHPSALVIQVALVLFSVYVLTACQSNDIKKTSKQKATTQSESTEELDAWLAKTQITNPPKWTPTTVFVLMQDGARIEVEAKTGTYSFRTSGRATEDYLVMALKNPETCHCWIGFVKRPPSDFYLETNGGILSIFNVPWGFDWFSSAIKNTGSNQSIDDIINLYDERKEYLRMYKDDTDAGETNLRGVLNIYFFGRWPGAAVEDPARIADMRITDGQLEVKMLSPHGDFQAHVWIDLKTKQVTKAYEDGKQVFPKESAQ